MKSRYPDAAMIHLPLIDSTNNYAMRLLDAEAAEVGLTILADAQTGGKGQRGNSWADIPGQSLLMSTILKPDIAIEHQFAFSAAVAVTVAGVLANLYEHWDLQIKWPNDIIINDRKAGGILIENVLRGSHWCYAVVGLGINVLQREFPTALPFATSLLRESRKSFDIKELAESIASGLLLLDEADITNGNYLARYNEVLFRKDALQDFSDGHTAWAAIVRGAGSNGLLKAELEDGTLKHYVHGSVVWKWK